MEMKGIKEVGTMKIQLKESTKPHRKRPYYVNPNMKKRVKIELNKAIQRKIHYYPC